MEYVSGQTSKPTSNHDPLEQALACNLGNPIASPLSEVQRHDTSIGMSAVEHLLRKDQAKLLNSG